jgi:ABC-type phosphate transport system substrate-binding protein
MRLRTLSAGRRGKAARALVYVLFSALAPLGTTSHASSQQKLQVVVNAGNPGVRITRSLLRAIFLDAQPRWADGTPVQAVDQPTHSQLRATFSSGVLGMSVGAVQAHWLRQNFNTAGKARPPKTRADDAAVLAFVRENPYAIGYVSPDVALDAGVKAVNVVE